MQHGRAAKVAGGLQLAELFKSTGTDRSRHFIRPNGIPGPVM
jgi:hypothetical protein